jgi:Tfp pilus assembly protein PilV
MIRVRGAASSMASGRPSSRWQMEATWTAFSSVTRKDGRTSCARCSNSLTASELARAEAVSAEPASGSESGGTCQLSSPSTPRVSRLVAMTVRAGQAASRLSASTAVAPARCSQLSSTTST